MNLEAFRNALPRNQKQVYPYWSSYVVIGDGIAHAAVAIVASEFTGWDHIKRTNFVSTAKSNKSMSRYVEHLGIDGYGKEVGRTKRRADLFEAWIGFLHDQFGYQYAILAAKEQAYYIAQNGHWG